MTTKNAGMATPKSDQSPTKPIMKVISDQDISESVMSHLREKRSATGPATNAMPASVQESTVLIQPIWTSVRRSSSWIGIVSSPKMARSAWWKKNAQERSATSAHL